MLMEKKGVSIYSIDFGNFQNLTLVQRQAFVRLSLATQSADFTKTVEAIALLTGADEILKARLVDGVDKVQWMQDPPDERIGRALGKALEVGFEIPPSLLNFTRSKVMLETAVRLLNDNLKRIDPSGEQYKVLELNRVFGRAALFGLFQQVRSYRTFTLKFISEITYDFFNSRVLSKLGIGESVTETVRPVPVMHRGRVVRSCRQLFIKGATAN